jgi:vacuolar-type H+-ATPase subunit F/Vma7
MPAVAVIGEEAIVGGYCLAGALVVPAEDPEAVRVAWSGLPDGVALVLLTEAAARAVGEALADRGAPLTAVMAG